MCSTHDMSRVDETECIGIISVYKSDAVQTPRLKPTSLLQVSPQPTHPKKMHQFPLSLVVCVDVKDPDHSGIPKWMTLSIILSGIFVRQHHDICMSAWINGILTPPHVVGSVVDPQDFVEIHLFVFETEHLAFFGAELILVTIIRPAQESC